MAMFVLIGRDAPGDGSNRAHCRPAHLEYWGARYAMEEVVFAGPLLDEAGTKAVGSLIIFEAGDLAKARDIAKYDPYMEHGVFGEIEVHPIKMVLPQE